MISSKLSLINFLVQLREQEEDNGYQTTYTPSCVVALQQFTTFIGMHYKSNTFFDFHSSVNFVFIFPQLHCSTNLFGPRLYNILPPRQSLSISMSYSVEFIEKEGYYLLHQLWLNPLHICLLHPCNSVYHTNDRVAFNDHRHQKHQVATPLPPRSREARAMYNGIGGKSSLDAYHPPCTERE